MFFNSSLTLITTTILPLLATIIGISFLVVIHEFGHFIMCKLFGILAPTFSIGFGPTLLKRKIGETWFVIAAIPLGGYVEIAGHEEVGQGEQKHAQLKGNRSFNAKPYWQQSLVIIAGIAINLVFAYMTFAGMYFVGVPKEQAFIMIEKVAEQSSAQEYGLSQGDILVGINTFTFSTEPQKTMIEMQNQLLATIQRNAGTTVDLHIRRKKKEKTITVALAEHAHATTGILGVTFGVSLSEIPNEYIRFNFLNSIQKGISQTHYYLAQIASLLKKMITQKTLHGAGGPVMIYSTSYKMAQRGIRPFLIFLAMLSITLAFMNLLPLGALDGGQWLFVTIDALLGKLWNKKLPETFKATLNIASWAFFILLTLVLSYRDIVRLFF